MPAGLGVLESMLLLLLPDVPPEQLLAAVLMYRAIYEIVPMLIALALVGVFRGIRDGRCDIAPGAASAPRDGAARPTVDSKE